MCHPILSYVCGCGTRVMGCVIPSLVMFVGVWFWVWYSGDGVCYPIFSYVFPIFGYVFGCGTRVMGCVIPSLVMFLGVVLG